MKKLIFVFALTIGTAVSFNAQTSSKKEKMEDSKMEMKEHTCTSACKDGKHMYAHGEKGHTCTKECKKMESSKENKMSMKEHTCTNECKNGKHMYAHGEKGHTCTDACKKPM